MGDPPLEAGASQETTTPPAGFGAAVTPVGAPGVVAGTAGAEAADAGPVPTPLVAVAVKV